MAADVNIGQVAASAFEAVVTDGPVDNIFTSQQLIYALNRDGFKEQVSGGTQFEGSLEYGINTTFRSMGENDPIDTTRINVFDAVRYPHKIFAGSIVFSDLEQVRNAPENRKFDIVERKIANGISSHMELMGVMLYGDGTGNGGLDWDGLAKLISDTPTTGTVGGVNAQTFTLWRNRQQSGAKTLTAFDNLRAVMESVFNQCSLGGTEKQPTSIISDRAAFEGYISLLTAVEKIERDARPMGGDIGFVNDAITFKGKNWMYDESCPAAHAYLLNNQYLKVWYLKGAWMRRKEAVEPANQLMSVIRVYTFGNLCTTARRHLGVVNLIS